MFGGVVALVVGLVGLVAPVSVSLQAQTVGCGSPIAPDFSGARAHDDRGAANVPVPGGIVADVNFTRLCEMELQDRRIWTITLAAVGALLIVGAAVSAARSRRMTRSP